MCTNIQLFQMLPGDEITRNCPGQMIMADRIGSAFGKPYIKIGSDVFYIANDKLPKKKKHRKSIFSRIFRRKISEGSELAFE